MPDLRPCPFCGSNPADVGMDSPYTFHSGTCYFVNRHCGDGELVGILWNIRPIEDALQRKLDIVVNALVRICEEPYSEERKYIWDALEKIRSQE